MTVARLFLAAGDRFPAPADAITCTTLDALDRVHRDTARHDVAIALGLTPAMRWSMLAVTIGRHRIASDAIHAIAVIRATGTVQVAGRTLDRAALLAGHRTLRALEAHLVGAIVEAIGERDATRWADDCRAVIDAWQQRRSRLRAGEPDMVRLPDAPADPLLQEAANWDRIVAVTSRTPPSPDA